MNMTPEQEQLLAQIKEQFDFAPYPNIPLELLPNPNDLYIHNLTTAYYTRNRRVVDSSNKLILDAGCGSGYKSLILAKANPDAKIIGIDFSQKSVELARQRFQYHGIENGEFYQSSIEELAQLGMSFDYINCDEVLYLCSDPTNILKIFKSVLNDQGIIRANLHSFLQRLTYFRCQKIFEVMGLLENNPEEMEIGVAIETMEALKDDVELKRRAWFPDLKLKENQERILVNYLLKGDKGYKIPEMFDFLREADLEFIGMLNANQWNILDLFKEPDNLPIVWGISLSEMPIEQKLHLYELLNPVHRLLDFWCGKPGESLPSVSPSEWTESQWQNTMVYLHPQFKTESIKKEMIDCVKQMRQFITPSLLPGSPAQIDPHIVAALLPLFESELTFPDLVEHYRKLYPFDPVTLEVISDEYIVNLLSGVLTIMLEDYGYVLLDPL